jgi:general secretion pathway protein B
MSYILDALRRADAERDRGTVPGLHSQPVPLAAEPPAPHRPVSWVWIAVAVALGVAGLLLWHSLAGDTEPAPAPAPPSVATPATTAVDPPTPPPPAAAAPTEAGPLPAPAPLPVARQPQSSRSLAAPTRRADAADETPARQGETPAIDDRSAPAAAPSTAPAARAGDVTPSQPAEATAMRREQLPEDVKRNLPPLAVGGSMYSPEPSQRMLILNGRVVREGDTVGPDLVLESIKLRSAVLRYKEQRFEIAY